MSSNRLEVMRHLQDFVRDALPSLLKTEDTYWQPSDFLPDMSQPDAFDQIRELQQAARELPDDLLAVLVGDMITEEALPTYSVWLHSYEGIDKGGEPRGPWGEWARKWTAEENRHGDVLNRYLYLTGRVNMREVEATIQNLISDGMDIKTGSDPYKAFAYTSFQEIATQVSHKNVAVRAASLGDRRLARLCSHVASDENRHAKAYKLFFEKILEVDPSDALLSFQEMMKSKVTMPAMYMREKGKQIGESFRKFADVAERTGVYTRLHYVDILQGLVRSWNIEALTQLTPAAEHAQQFLCSLPERYRKVAERFENVSKELHSFSWLNGGESTPVAQPS